MRTAQTVAQQNRPAKLNLNVGHLVFGFVLTIFMAACGGAPPPPAASTNAPAVSQAATAPAANPAANTPAASSRSVPGTEEFGMTKEELVKNIEAVEAQIARCMNDAGFEYVAVDYDTVRRGMLADKSLPGVSDEDFIAQFGYGISTLYTGLGPQQTDTNTPAKTGLGEQNVRIFNSLSAADQVAYNRTLFGENTDATFAVSLEAEDFSRTGGCTLAAIKQVFSPVQLSLSYINPKDSLIEQDPRMIAALTKFSDCVREEGFNYNHPGEIEPDIKNRLFAITKGAPPDALTADARAALTELQGEERAIASLATTCEEDIVEPVYAQIERELYANQASPIK
jgi:hypothetical protein